MAEEGVLPEIYIVSDSLGETAEGVVKAAASQFDGGSLRLQRAPHVDSEESILETLARASRQPRPPVVVYTLVRPDLRSFLQREAERRGLVAVDLLGPLMQALAQASQVVPKLQPVLLHRLDEEYFHRVEAVEFAVRYDDGKDLQGLALADVVLIGVSRVSKTPVSMYLAHRRVRVANVPLIPEVEPPQALASVPRGRLIGLTIQPDKLLAIRRQRLHALGLSATANYADPRRVERELRFAEDVFARLGCAVIDVSDRAVEETARRVLELLRKAGLAPAP